MVFIHDFLLHYRIRFAAVSDHICLNNSKCPLALQTTKQPKAIKQATVSRGQGIDNKWDLVLTNPIRTGVESNMNLGPITVAIYVSANIDSEKLRTTESFPKPADTGWPCKTTSYWYPNRQLNVRNVLVTSSQSGNYLLACVEWYLFYNESCLLANRP